MYKTHLYDEHLKLNGKMVDFAGWQMPIQYKNLKEEVLAVRNNVGVFDVSHMGEFFVEGEDSLKFIDHLLPNDIYNAEIGKAVYSPLLREDGTIIDDLIVYKISPQRILLCVNAANIEKDFAWIRKQSENFNVQLSDKSAEYSLLAIQGPKSFEVLKSLNSTKNIEDIDYYSIQVNENSLYARTGYTGEDGFEVFGSHEFIFQLWKELMNAGVQACGLGARDVLRLEVCYPLYGNELNDEVTPLESGLKWTTKFQKEFFIGKKKLEESTPKSRLIKLTLDKGIPRQGYKVFNGNDQEIGEITSGTMSVMLEKGIALARIKKDLYNNEETLFVEIRSKMYPAQINKKPFYVGGHK